MRFFGSSQGAENDPLEPTVHTRLAGEDPNETFEDSETQSSLFSTLRSNFNTFVSSSEPEASGTNEPFFPSLSYQTRILGFLSCFLCGFVLSFFSSFTLMTGNLKRFAFIYTIGNIIALLGTGFLVGPKRQLESMFDARRKLSASIYLGTMFMTVFLALIGKGVLIVLPLLIVQWCAGIWYSASYVPYGREAVKGFVNSVTGLQI